MIILKRKKAYLNYRNYSSLRLQNRWDASDSEKMLAFRDIVVLVVCPYRPETPPNEENDHDRDESSPVSPNGSADENGDLKYELRQRGGMKLRKAALQERRLQRLREQHYPTVPNTVQFHLSIRLKRESSTVQTRLLYNRLHRLHRSCRHRVGLYRFADKSSDDEGDDGGPQTRRRLDNDSEHPSRNRDLLTMPVTLVGRRKTLWSFKMENIHLEMKTNKQAESSYTTRNMGGRMLP
ncbi:hypothetical protein J6590_006706 [Homalodisca vitripennis]|nr:hypothetical protein J6590_006706 [Homalodisca vitripennis]